MAGLISAADPTYTSASATNPLFYLNWRYEGPFKGVAAGHWSEAFTGQGTMGYLWSSSTYSGTADAAYSTYFGIGHGPTETMTDIYNYRYRALGVRCVLNGG